MLYKISSIESNIFKFQCCIHFRIPDYKKILLVTKYTFASFNAYLKIDILSVYHLQFKSEVLAIKNY